MRELSAEELMVGASFRTRFVFTEEIVSSYMSILGLAYEPDRPLPTSVFATNKPSYLAMGGRMPQGTIHVKQAAEHDAPVYAGVEYEVEVLITDKYERKGRQYLVYETTFSHAGELVSRQSTTQLLSFTQPAEGGAT